MSEPILSIDNVRKQFATVTAVDGVSLHVPRGAIFALLGPNGAGKTTLLRMVLGLIRPDSGTISFGNDIAHGPGIDPQRIGYLPEDRGLYPDVEVLRTLTYFGSLRGMERRDARTAAQEWLERMSLRDRAREPLKSLSKGNQQKIQFISAILHRPALAILDEPFSGLDPLNQELFLTLIRDLRDTGATVLLSAHQMQLVEKVADIVAVMNRGQLIVRGTLPDVRRRWTTGSRLVVNVGTTPPHGFLSSHARVSVQVREPDEVEVFVPDGELLGPLLTEIGAQLDVRNIVSHHVTLHDVYVNAIAEHDETAGAAR